MWVKCAAVVSLLALAACGGNPWVEEDGAEPDVFGGSIYATDLDEQLTMDSMVYDSETGELIVNNIPFDGANAPNGQALYARTGAVGATSFSRYEDTAGTLAYYAVFRRSTSGATQAGAFATSGYIDFGIGGASAQRNTETVNLPASGEYSFTGEYAAVRVFENAAGMPNQPQYVTGAVQIEMDFGDFDEVGAIVGVISNRQLFDVNGTALGPMDDFVSLAMSEIDRSTGIVAAETAVGVSGNTAEELTSGQWTAILGGPNGTEIAGIVVLEGLANDTPPDGSTPGNVRETGVFIALR
ncbi:MAG: hypothetical protein JNJ84_15175 [Rhodobacteraceae bacterium]|nr:hypothetical protein [Paracoccaceae bacterium]